MKNLQPLFEIQAKTDKMYTEKHPIQEEENRREKRFLALLTEVGELANETRSFKYWSKDQEPRKEETKQGVTKIGLPARHIVKHNPQLEEYVDCLHFILGIGIDVHSLDFISERLCIPDVVHVQKDVNRQFNSLFKAIVEYRDSLNFSHYASMFRCFIALGQALGYTWEEIEAAYMSKNEINFERQANSY